MGVDYSPVLYVGKQFEDEPEAVEFYRKNIGLTEEDEEYIDECGFQEFCYNLEDGLDGDTLNYYNSYGFVLGVDIGSSVRNHEKFAEVVSDAIIKWKELFKDEPFEIIHTVRIW